MHSKTVVGSVFLQDALWLRVHPAARRRQIENPQSQHYHVSCLSQKKCRLMPTIKSNASWCMSAARAGTNDCGALVPEEQHFVGYVMEQTWHKQSTRSKNLLLP